MGEQTFMRFWGKKEDKKLNWIDIVDGIGCLGIGCSVPFIVGSLILIFIMLT
jgi:hypothetical protein